MIMNRISLEQFNWKSHIHYKMFFARCFVFLMHLMVDKNSYLYNNFQVQATIIYREVVIDG